MALSSAKKDFRKTGVFKISHQILLQIFELATENSRSYYSDRGICSPLSLKVNQTISQLVNQPTNQLFIEPINQSTSQPTSQSARQSVNQPTSK